MTSPWPARPGPTAFWFRRFPAWRISTAIADRLSDINADTSIRVWAMIETARAVLHAEELAAASRDSETRLAGFVFGPNDISRETRIRMQPGRAAMMPLITHCILATRAYGLEILDGPYSDFSNFDGFGQECTQARDLGFDGKTLIHPGQIEACNAIFTPPRGGSRACPQDHRGIRTAGKRLARRDPARRPDGGAAARRYGEAHDCDRGRDRGDGGKADFRFRLQDVIHEIIGLTRREDQIRHAAVARPKEHLSESSVVDGRWAMPSKSGAVACHPRRRHLDGVTMPCTTLSARRCPARIRCQRKRCSRPHCAGGSRTAPREQ